MFSRRTSSAPFGGRQRLDKLLKAYPYLDSSSHLLNEQIIAVKQQIAAGEDPDDLLDRIEAENETEQQTLAAAFRRFDTKGRKVLDKTEMKLMSEYLGFPSSDKDVSDLMAAIDTDGSGGVSFDEFNEYVGKIGGSMVLFETRRARMTDRMRTGSVSDFSMEKIQSALLEANIDREAQASWRLVIAPSEFNAVGELVKPQKDALRHIRLLAKANHEKAMPLVQRRVKELGHTETELYMTLAWIRELAPLLVHANLDKMLPFMESDTHYRNQFETGKSGGLLNTDVRKKWEKDLFGGKYDKAEGSERPKYGVQNVMNDYRGVVKCAQYGDSYLILKDVRLRCTFAPEDSANLKAERLAVLDFYAHVLNEYSNDELKETLKVANSKDAAIIGDSDKVGKMKYKEAQIHGDVAFAKNVERLVAATRHKGKPEAARILAVCRKYGWAMSWMDEERERMRKEDMHKLGGEAWAQRLMKDDGGSAASEVRPGCCHKGCGRKVAPGCTRAGNAYTTCCRGCVMGFGHDLMCGTIDASKVGPGMCKNGCGRPVAPGTDSKGRSLTTCCRGCALGFDHDATCGRAPTESDSSFKRTGTGWMCSACGQPNTSTATSCGGCLVDKPRTAKVLCKAGCGRSVAPGVTRSGKPFDTCCKGCATGTDHTPECTTRMKMEGK